MDSKHQLNVVMLVKEILKYEMRYRGVYHIYSSKVTILSRNYSHFAVNAALRIEDRTFFKRSS